MVYAHYITVRKMPNAFNGESMLSEPLKALDLIEDPASADSSYRVWNNPTE
jgi:hypothetical protein